ncbi:hypothetical protein GGI12_003235 [Dipsacomyces acuminosporus]|nr:hypothetical protein GGI12_003235 [Dipsacomyces acuminosporus]
MAYNSGTGLPSKELDWWSEDAVVRFGTNTQKSNEPAWQDVGANVLRMDSLYDASFHDWLKCEDNVSIIASYLQRIANEYPMDRIINALRWLVSSWRVESTAVIVRHITSDWAAPQTPPKQDSAPFRLDPPSVSASQIDPAAVEGECRRGVLVRELTKDWSCQQIAQLVSLMSLTFWRERPLLEVFLRALVSDWDFCHLSSFFSYISGQLGLDYRVKVSMLQQAARRNASRLSLKRARNASGKSPAQTAAENAAEQQEEGEEATGSSNTSNKRIRHDSDRNSTDSAAATETGGRGSNEGVSNDCTANSNSTAAAVAASAEASREQQSSCTAKDNEADTASAAAVAQELPSSSSSSLSQTEPSPSLVTSTATTTTIVSPLSSTNIITSAEQPSSLSASSNTQNSTSAAAAVAPNSSHAPTPLQAAVSAPFTSQATALAPPPSNAGTMTTPSSPSDTAATAEATALGAAASRLAQVRSNVQQQQQQQQQERLLQRRRSRNSSSGGISADSSSSSPLVSSTNFEADGPHAGVLSRRPLTPQITSGIFLASAADSAAQSSPSVRRHHRHNLSYQPSTPPHTATTGVSPLSIVTAAASGSSDPLSATSSSATTSPTRPTLRLHAASVSATSSSESSSIINRSGSTVSLRSLQPSIRSSSGSSSGSPPPASTSSAPVISNCSAEEPCQQLSSGDLPSADHMQIMSSTQPGATPPGMPLEQGQQHQQEEEYRARTSSEGDLGQFDGPAPTQLALSLPTDTSAGTATMCGRTAGTSIRHHPSRHHHRPSAAHYDVLGIVMSAASPTSPTAPGTVSVATSAAVLGGDAE